MFFFSFLNSGPEEADSFIDKKVDEETQNKQQKYHYILVVTNDIDLSDRIVPSFH